MVASEQVVVSVLTISVVVGLGRSPLLWPVDVTLRLDCGTSLDEGDAELDGTGGAAVTPISLGEPSVLDDMTGTKADVVFSEQRRHVVIVLVIKLVATMMEVLPLWTRVVVTGQLVTVV